jgi:hypothetical protein
VRFAKHPRHRLGNLGIDRSGRGVVEIHAVHS